MVRYSIKQIHNISRPGKVAVPGDTVEIETVGGFVPKVDPRTRQALDAHQRFVVRDDAGHLDLPLKPKGLHLDRLVLSSQTWKRLTITPISRLSASDE